MNQRITEVLRLAISCSFMLVPSVMAMAQDYGTPVRDTDKLSSSGSTSRTPDGYRIDDCRVEFISEPILAFEEPGVLTNVPKEGDRVESGDTVAQLNDDEIQLRIEVAEYSYDAAKLEADSDIRVRYADMQAKVALADFESGREANTRQPNIVPKMEMRRRRAEYDAGKMGIENARHDMAIAVATARIKQAEWKQARALLTRLQLRSPITGIVTERIRHEGEYVRAGDPVVRIGQLDRLRVDGLVSFKELPQREASGRRVRIRIPVEFDLATGDPVFETFGSEIRHVAAEVDIDDKYRVWAEIDNRREFIVRPGMIGEMTILD